MLFLSNVPSISIAEEVIRIESLGRKFDSNDLQNTQSLLFSDVVLIGSDFKKLKHFSHLKEVTIQKSKIPADIIQHLYKATQIKKLTLDNVTISTKVLIKIAGLTQLQSLHIRTTPITENVLNYISKLKNLTDLEISHVPVTSRMIQFVNQLSNLKILILKNTQIGDTELSKINLLLLEQLDISYTNVQGNGFSKPQQFGNLKHLNLNHSKLNDRSFNHLRHFKNLISLDISDTKLTDDFIENLTLLPAIENLKLDNLPLTIKSLPLLKNLPNLTYLSISGVKLVFQDFMLFKKQAENIEIIAHYLVSDKNSDESQDFEARGQVYHKAKFVLSEPLLMGMAVPFKILFLNDDHQPDEDYQLRSNLVLEIKNTKFNINHGKHQYSGNQSIEMPMANIQIEQGVIKGRIVVDRLVTGQKISIFLKQTNPHQLSLIGKNKIDLFHNQVAGILFSTKSKDVIAGQAFTLELQLYNHLGRPQFEIVKKKPTLYISGLGPLEINNKKISKRIDLKIEKRNTVKNLSIIGERAGSYAIHFENNYFYGEQKKGYSWNTFMFEVKPARLINSVFNISDTAAVGELVPIHRFDVDRYGNKVIPKILTNMLMPHQEKSIISSNRFQKNGVREDFISFQKPGVYKIKLKGIGKIVTKTIVVK